MSHEIRTPLSAIIGFSGLLKKTGLSDSQREYILTITQAASQLLQIIDDILGYTRLDSNTLPIESGEFNLYETLENVVSILSVLAHEKHLELVLYIHSDVPQYISSDPNRISQVLTNLINNAIKFTDKGHVVVEVSALDSDSDTVTINFAVTDTGIGMSEAQLSQVFDPFIQADVSISREYGGTGLGLSISKKLVDLLGGEIDVSSQPGKGTTFSFTITTPFEITEKDSERRPLTGNKVLVYDCNPFSLRALRNRFLTLGATVFNTSNRARLLEMIAANKQCDSHCDLLVMGLSLEEYDGIAHDAWLDDVRRSCDTPALVLIGDELHDQPTCLEQERMCILSKPPRSDRLLRQVRKMLSLAQGTSAATDTEIPGPGIPEDHVCLNILVAEDNRFNQQLFSELLGNLGAHVSLASNGKEACELAEHRLFDLVFMDIHMPVMGGVKATQQIRNGKNRLTPVVALTADVFVDSEQQLRSLGLDDILYKPVSEQKLVNMLDRWCKPRLPDTGTGKRDTAALPPAFQKRLQRELGRQLNTLRKAIDSDNQELFADHMHQLKGLVQYFGLKEFTDGFGLLEKAHDTGAIHAAMDTLEALLMQMVADTRAT
jgi:polar amino acid transport system substrate-binding protein